MRTNKLLIKGCLPATCPPLARQDVLQYLQPQPSAQTLDCMNLRPHLLQTAKSLSGLEQSTLHPESLSPKYRGLSNDRYYFGGFLIYSYSIMGPQTLF